MWWMASPQVQRNWSISQQKRDDEPWTPAMNSSAHSIKAKQDAYLGLRTRLKDTQNLLQELYGETDGNSDFKYAQGSSPEIDANGSEVIIHSTIGSGKASQTHLQLLKTDIKSIQAALESLEVDLQGNTSLTPSGTSEPTLSPHDNLITNSREMLHISPQASALALISDSGKVQSEIDLRERTKRRLEHDPVDGTKSVDFNAELIDITLIPDFEPHFNAIQVQGPNASISEFLHASDEYKLSRRSNATVGTGRGAVRYDFVTPAKKTEHSMNNMAQYTMIATPNSVTSQMTDYRHADNMGALSPGSESGILAKTSYLPSSRLQQNSIEHAKQYMSDKIHSGLKSGYMDETLVGHPSPGMTSISSYSASSSATGSPSKDDMNNHYIDNQFNMTENTQNNNNTNIRATSRASKVLNVSTARWQIPVRYQPGSVSAVITSDNGITKRSTSRENLSACDTTITFCEQVYRPFMRIARRPQFKSPFLFMQPQNLNNQEKSWELCLWTIFQIYGRNSASSDAMVKTISKMQLSRAIREAGVSSETYRKLEIELIGLGIGIPNANNSSTSAKRTGLNKGKGVPIGGALNKKTDQPHKLNLSSSGPVAGTLSFSEFIISINLLLTLMREKDVADVRASLSTSDIPTLSVQVCRDRLMQRFRNLLRTEAHVIKVADWWNPISTAYHACVSGVVPKNSYILTADSISFLVNASGGELHTFDPSSRFLIQTHNFEAEKVAISHMHAVRSLWTTNFDSIRHLYARYASATVTWQPHPTVAAPGLSKAHADSTLGFNLTSILSFPFESDTEEHFITGNGLQMSSGHKTIRLLSFDNTKKLLTDYDLCPKVIDLQVFTRIYRSVKLWEWELFASIPLGTMEGRVDGTQHKIDSLSINYNAMPAGSHLQLRSIDPLGLATTAYNLCLTPAGFVELLTRLASHGYRYRFHSEEVPPRDQVVNLMRYMNNSQKGNTVKAGGGNANISKPGIQFHLRSNYTTHV